ncbi:MAG: M28 family peptidase [Gemmatimonadetes bacterium]|nr:M28 family peptidase [Gemmatimonadota bacterium]NNM05843.1 M28 family peptidase [Gemmatimonadota bacterium]
MKIPPILLSLPFLAGAWACGPADGAGVPDQSGGDPDSFVAGDSTQILADLEILSHDSLEGRRTGTRGGALAQGYIRSRLEAAGLEPPPTGHLQPFEFSGRRDPTQVTRGANVVGFVEGRDPSLGAIVLTAHFDHLGIRAPRPGTPAEAEGDSIFNGADDNASGTVAVMSLARYFARYPPRHRMVFALVDAEEMGLRGAYAFVEAGWPEGIALNVNLDMVARSDSLLFIAGTHHYPRLRPLMEKVVPRSPVVLRFGHDQRGVEGMQDWTGSSDHRAFHAEGIPFLYFGVEDHPDYHRASDEFEAVEPAFFLNAVRTLLVAVKTLDEELDSITSPVSQTLPDGR